MSEEAALFYGGISSEDEPRDEPEDDDSDLSDDELALSSPAYEPPVEAKPGLRQTTQAHDEDEEDSETSDEEEWETLPVNPPHVASAKALSAAQAFAALESEKITVKKPIQAVSDDERKKLESEMFKEQQYLFEIMHKCHLVCLMGRFAVINKTANNDEIQALMLSVAPKTQVNMKYLDITRVSNLAKWFSRTFTLDAEADALKLPSSSRTTSSTCTTPTKPISVVSGVGRGDAAEPILLDDSEDEEEEQENRKENEKKKEKELEKEKDTPHAQDTLCSQLERCISSRRADCEAAVLLFCALLRGLGYDCRIVSALPAMFSRVTADSSVRQASRRESTTSKTQSQTTKTKTKTNKRRQSDESSLEAKKAKMCNIDFWCEVRSHELNTWVSVCPLRHLVNQHEKLESYLTVRPCGYVVAFDAKQQAADVTPKYCKQWMSERTRLRPVHKPWWKACLAPFQLRVHQAARDHEWEQLLEQQVRQGIPKALKAYKNHQLYCIERFLKQTEMIYPREPILGYCRGEPVFLRECVQPLKSKQAWFKLAREVKEGEEAVKQVSRKKGDEETSTQLFGEWQTQAYVPPTAINGIVPKNNHGTVDLFQPSMLPIGTVHLADMPGIKHVAIQLGVDFAEAVVDFQYQQSRMIPVKDGVVVCQEAAELLREAYAEQSHADMQKEIKEKEERVSANWKRLLNKVAIFVSLGGHELAKS